MPPRSVRTKPLTSPERQLRHFRLKRSQILCALGKSSFINGSQFAILLVEPSGDSEVFGSAAFERKLGSSGWFANGILGEARELAAAARAEHVGGARADVFCASGAVIPVEADADDGFVGRAGEDDWDDDEDEGETYARSAFAPLEGGSRPSSATALHPHHQVAPSSAPSSSLVSFTTSASAPVSPSVPDTRVTRSLSMLAVNEVPSHPSPANSHHSPAAAPSSSGPSGTHHSKAAPTVRPVVFTPTTLSAWYTEKFTQLQPKAQNIVCPKWVAVVEAHVPPYQTVEGSAPSWWPQQIVYRDPKLMQKPDRVALLSFLIRGVGVPISAFEAATASIDFTNAKAVTMTDIYKVANEEQRVLRANNNVLFEFLTVVLPVSNLNPNPSPNPTSDVSPSEPKVTRHRTRRSIASATLPTPDEPVRPHASHAPYPLSRSHSAIDIPKESSRPLSRSHSLSGHSKRDHLSSGGGRPRKARTSMVAEREEHDRGYHLDQVREGQSPRIPIPGSLLYEYPQHFAGPSPPLQPPILLYSQPPRDEPLDNRRHSHEGTPYQAPRLIQEGSSASSQRMQHSPSEGAYSRSRSQQNEPSFASPAMIKSRSRNIGAVMGSIAESPQHDLAPSAPIHRQLQVQVHPGHDFDPYQYSADYPTPSYPPSHPQYQPPHSLPAHREVVEDHHQRQQSRHDRELLRRHEQNLQAQQHNQFLLDRDLEAQQVADHQMALQQQQYVEDQRQHQQAAFYYSNDAPQQGYAPEQTGYGLMPSSFEMVPQGSHEMVELGLGGIAGAYPDIAAVELFEQERRKDSSRRYDEIMYGVQA